MISKSQPLSLGGSEPDVEPTVEQVGELLRKNSPNAVVGVPGRIMSRDDHLVAKPLAAGEEIIEMHMAVFVNLLPSMAAGDKSHFCNQDHRLVHGGAVIKPVGV